jgi:hypothetical protein
MATWTVQQSGGDYTTLNAALSNASTGPNDTINIQGSWTAADTTSATIIDDGLTIQCLGASKHPGYYDTAQNHYRLRTTGSGHSLTLSGNFGATIDGISIEQAGTTTSAEGFRCVPGSTKTVTIKNSLLWCSTSTSQQDCIYTGFNATIGTVDIQNSMIWRGHRGGVHSQNSFTANHGGAWKINSSTIWGCGGEADGGNLLFATSTGGGSTTFAIDCHNCDCVGKGAGTGSRDYRDFRQGNGTGPLSWDVSYSIDSDGSIAAETDGGTGNLASRTATDNTSPGAGDWVIFEDITTSPFDFRLVNNAENDAQDMHAVATAHGLTIPATDIIGTARPQATNYDCGAFEIAVVVGGGKPRDLLLLGVGA